MPIRWWLLLWVTFLPGGLFANDDRAERASDIRAAPAATQPANPWAELDPRLRAGFEADARARGLTLEAVLEAHLLRHLADSMADAYGNLANLSFESRIYCSERPFKRGDEVDLSFDEAAAELGRVRCWMKPNQQMRAELTIGGEEVWGIVSADCTRSPDGRATVVQWTGAKQTSPYQAGPGGARNYLIGEEELRELAPGKPTFALKCILPTYLTSFLPNPGDTPGPRSISLRRELMIAFGSYDGLLPTADGRIAHRTSRVDRNGVFVYRWYVDPDSFLLLQEDKMAAVECLLPKPRVVAAIFQRWTFGDFSTEPIPDERFEPPPAGERTVVDFGPAGTQEGGAED